MFRFTGGASVQRKTLRGGLEVGLQHSEAQKAEFRQLYATRRRNQLMVNIPPVAVTIGVVLPEDRAAGTILGLSASCRSDLPRNRGGCVVLTLFRNWRCPACHKYLGRGFNPRHCQNCGVELGG